MRQRRADARIRLRILADSSLLSGHHASHVPLVAAAPRAPGRAAELDVVTVALAAILTDVSTLRAELEGVRTQLTAALAEVAKLRGDLLAPLPEPPPRPAEDHSGLLQPGLGEDIRASWPAEAPPEHGRNAPAEVQLVHGGGVPASWPATSPVGAVDVTATAPRPCLASGSTTTEVACRNCKGTGTTLFGPCVVCASAASRGAAEVVKYPADAFILASGSTTTDAARIQAIAATIKSLQRRRPDASTRWAAHCEANFEGTKDPSRHSLASLAKFAFQEAIALLDLDDADDADEKDSDFFRAWMREYRVDKY